MEPIGCVQAIQRANAGRPSFDPCFFQCRPMLEAGPGGPVDIEGRVALWKSALFELKSPVICRQSCRISAHACYDPRKSSEDLNTLICALDGMGRRPGKMGPYTAVNGLKKAAGGYSRYFEPRVTDGAPDIERRKPCPSRSTGAGCRRCSPTAPGHGRR